jgi:hypothetical protein
MTSRRASFRQADAARALRAAVLAGLRPSRFTINPDGSITVSLEEGGGGATGNSFDRLLEQAK